MQLQPATLHHATDVCIKRDTRRHSERCRTRGAVRHRRRELFPPPYFDRPVALVVCGLRLAPEL
jgi:hypothetical protein